MEAGVLHLGSPGPATSHDILEGATLGCHRLTGRAVNHPEVRSRLLRKVRYIGNHLRRRLGRRSLSAVPGVLQCRAELQSQAGRPLRCALDASADRDGGELSEGFKNSACRLLGRRAFSDAGLGSDGLNELGDGIGGFGNGVTKIHLGLRLLLGGLGFCGGAGSSLGLLFASFEVNAFFTHQGKRLGLCTGDQVALRFSSCEAGLALGRRSWLFRRRSGRGVRVDVNLNAVGKIDLTVSITAISGRIHGVRIDSGDREF